MQLLSFVAFSQQLTLKQFVDNAHDKKVFPLTGIAEVEALLAKPSDAKTIRHALMYLGNNYYDLGQYDEAFGYYKKGF